MLRKLLPIPVALSAWVAVLLGTLWFAAWRVRTFCPAGLREGSVCYAEGWEIHPFWLVCLGAMLSAFAVVWAVAISAVRDRIRAATFALVVGSVGALELGVATQYPLPVILAITAGAGALWSVRWFFRQDAN